MSAALPGCVASLRDSIALLDSSIDTLDSGVSDYPRLAKVLQTTRHFELLPESTLQSAQSALLSTIGPELDSLLSRVETHLERLARREQTLAAKAELLAGRLEAGSENAKFTRLGESKAAASGADEESTAKRMKQLRQKKDRLSFAVDRLQMQAQQKERRLRMSMAAQDV